MNIALGHSRLNGLVGSFMFSPFKASRMMLERSKTIPVVPTWPNQPWFASVLKITKKIISFKQRQDNLSSPNTWKHHQSWTNVPLTACHYWKDGLIEWGYRNNVEFLHYIHGRRRYGKSTGILQWMVHCDFHRFDPYEPSLNVWGWFKVQHD